MQTPDFLCIICKGKLVKEVISNGYIYYKCKNCFTSQVLPHPSKIDLDNYYNKFHLQENEGGVYDWIEERMQSDFYAKINFLKKFRNEKNNCLLDVGCGKGYFVAKCNELGLNARGIDVSSSGIEFAKNKLGVDADLGSIEEFADLPGYKENFGFVTLLATIEHLRDPFSVLYSINKCLKPGGILLFDTGLGNDKFEKYLTGYSQWYDAPQHLFVYSEEGLKKILNDSGYKVLTIDINFERNTIRKYVRWIRHAFICIASFIIIRPVIGRKGFESMKMESKWPIGKLISVIAQKIN